MQRDHIDILVPQDVLYVENYDEENSVIHAGSYIYCGQCGELVCVAASEMQLPFEISAFAKNVTNRSFMYWTTQPGMLHETCSNILFLDPTSYWKFVSVNKANQPLPTVNEDDPADQASKKVYEFIARNPELIEQQKKNSVSLIKALQSIGVKCHAEVNNVSGTIEVYISPVQPFNIELARLRGEVEYLGHANKVLQVTLQESYKENKKQPVMKYLLLKIFVAIVGLCMCLFAMIELFQSSMPILGFIAAGVLIVFLLLLPYKKIFK